MILMDEMLPLKLYSSKQRAYLPFNPSNKKKNSMVTLLTRSLKDSVDLMNMPFFMNPNYFISYYMDRNVKRYLSNDGKITIEGEEEDPDEEGFTEAVLRAAPKKNGPMIEFVSAGTNNDKHLLEEYFKKKKFDEWYDYFHIGKSRRVYPTVYGCMDMKEMFDAIGDQAIMGDGRLIANSYNSKGEIFVLNNSEYQFENSDGPYKLYCKGAVITYVVSVAFPKIQWALANDVGTALSGQAQYIYEKNNYKIDEEKIGMALFISKYEKDKGRSGMIKLCATGNPSVLVPYGAKNVINKFSIKFGLKEETVEFGEPYFCEAADDMVIIERSRAENKDFLKRKGHFDPLWNVRMMAQDAGIGAPKRPKNVAETGDYEGLHPWLMWQVEHAKDLQRVKYLRSDAYTGINQLMKLKSNMQKVQNGIPDKYVSTAYINKLLRKGNSPEKIDKHIKWMKSTYIPALNAKAKELRKTMKESTILESDGTPMDTMYVYKALNHKDRHFVANDDDFDLDSSKRAIYRHIERDDLYQIKGFIEILTSDTEPYVVIAVHPKFRGQGVATKLVKTMLKEFHKEHPEFNTIIWRADKGNKKSIELAEKMGFQTIKVNSQMHCLRYEYKEEKLYSCIPKEILNETDLVNYCKSHFDLDYSMPTDQLYKIRDLKTIVHSKKINKFEMAYFLFVGLRKVCYPCFFALLAETDGTYYNVGDIEPVVGCGFDDETYYFNAFAPYYGKKGMMVSKVRRNPIDLFHQFHFAYKWGDISTYPVTICTKTFMEPYEIEPGKMLYADYVIPAIKEQFPEGSKPLTEATLVEFTTRSKLAPPEFINEKFPMRLSHLKKVKIDDKVIDKYGKQMGGLHHVRMTNSCEGYLFVNKKDEPVCYYNIQKKPNENGEPVVWLQAIEVGEDYKGRSLGNQLIEKAVSDHHVTNLAVDKENQVAIRMYKSMGFQTYNMNGSMMNMRKKSLKSESFTPPADMCMRVEDYCFVFTNERPNVLSEALSQTAYNTKLRQYLWKERIRTQGAQVEIFQQVKAQCPKIKKTYVNPKMYKGLNVFMDMSYYNGLFLENNITKKDIAINFYWEYLNRMINSTDEYFKTTYTKNTVFIPVWKGAWDCKEGTFIYDWKDNLNPISMIFRMIRKNPTELRKWSNINFVFVGRTGYFRVDFARFQLKDLVKFKTRLNKLWSNEPIEDDEDEDGYGRTQNPNDEEHTSAAIAVKVIDDIEQSTGVEINDVSKAVKSNSVSIDKIDPTKLEIVPNLRIRNTAIPSIGEPVCVGVVAPTTKDSANAIKYSNTMFSKKMRYVYKK